MILLIDGGIREDMELGGKTPEEFGEWLFGRMEASPLGAEIPRENLHLICEQAGKFFLADNRLQTQGLFEWLCSEYGFEWARLAEMFTGFQASAAEFGVEIVIAAPPGDNDCTFDAGALPHEDSLADENAGSITVGDDEDEEESMAVLASEVEEEESRAKAEAEAEKAAETAAHAARVCASGTGANVKQARPRRPWQMLPPKWRDPDKALSGFLADGKYLEFAYFDHLLEGVARKEKRLERLLERSFKPTEEERDLFKGVGLSPGTDSDTVEAWVLRVNAMALAFAYALDLAKNQISFDMRDWLRGVRQLNASYGDISSKILAKREEAKGRDGCALAGFELAWSRLRNFHNDVQPEIERLSSLAAGKELEERKAAKGKKAPATADIGRAVEVDYGTGPMAFIHKNQVLLMAVVGLLLAVSAGYGLYATGLLKGSGLTDVSIDVSGSGLTPSKVFSDGNGVVLVVDRDQWSSRTKEQKEESLKVLYEAAVKAGYKQVQVWSADDKTLGMALSRNMVTVLQ